MTKHAATHTFQLSGGGLPQMVRRWFFGDGAAPMSSGRLNLALLGVL